MYWTTAADLPRRLMALAGLGLGLFGVGGVVWLHWGDLATVVILSQAPWVVAHRSWVQGLSDWGMYVFYLPAIAGYFRYRFLPWVHSLLLAWLGAELLGVGLLGHLIKMVTGRARPDQALLQGGGDQWLGMTWDSHFHSFPSGHTADLFTSAFFVVLLLRPRWIGVVAVGIAVGVALSRIALAKHYPTDILGGMGLAYLSLGVALAWHNFRQPPPARYSLNLIVNEHDQLLLLRRSPQTALGPGLWGLPAGHIEPEETAEACARREAQEEIGPDHYLELVAYRGPLQDQYYGGRMEIHLFHWRWQGGIVVLNEEHTDWAWVGPEDYDKYSVMAGIDENIACLGIWSRRQKSAVTAKSE